MSDTAMATTTTTTSSSSSLSPSSLAIITTETTSVPINNNLELHLLQSFGTFAIDKIVNSYFYLKNWSRLLGFFANTTEKIVTKTGLISIVTFIYTQYRRLGHPWLEYVDDAMGRRIINVFVTLLFLAKEKQEEQDLEKAQNFVSLNFQERIHALLQGEIPRLEQLLQEAKEKEALALEKANEPAPPIVMDLKDFVSVDEVKRIKEENQEEVDTLQEEIQQLKEQMNLLQKSKQKLEQDLTDVHNYQETERGKRFQEMEEELARTKLEVNQKAHELRKMEIVVEAFRKKRKGGKGSRTGTPRSVTHSEGGAAPTSPVNNNVVSA